MQGTTAHDPTSPHRTRLAVPRRRGWGLLAVAMGVVLIAGACAGGGSADPGPASTDPGSESSPSSTATTTTTARPEPSPCSTASWSREERVAATVFASLADGSIEGLDQALATGAGGIFVSTAAVPLVADGTIAERTAATELPPLVAIDEEGGRVQRLRDVVGRLPSGRVMARTMDPSEIRTTAATHGAQLAELGITVDFAPVVDVSDEPDDGPIGDRSFGADPESVVAAAGAFAAGLDEAGVLPTLKHFPGHGRASGDSHDEAVSTPPIDQMGPDLEPFRTIPTEVPVAIMIGHMEVPGLTNGVPSSLSPAAIDGLLRGDLGFDGLVVTDDLAGMRAIQDRYTTEDAAVLALAAGADMVLVPTSSFPAVAAAISAAVDDGRLTEARLTEAADRVLAARSPAGTCPT
ncbi:glycoside hydrolase family 3 N-terminal domain-containing protein [Rhabdothermincola salaria]|uniref:glycoside hydrolase family 3 N-terminal domain-containing protein n=1 Tax=Rhabdothermincola salaria TaxID=2903142 RepID=UPI001E4654CC|nr:glycoside hydrolase family 3 N-terminal domain-containing protein [Rhabdothermincola salaria]MCD9625693.1 hypothetical protein [Rhabdothermincola salaria]